MGGFTILALVCLRVVVGWHFFSEGMQKVTYDRTTGQFDVKFSAEGFLRQAKGPMAYLLKNWIPNGHDWEKLLKVPVRQVPLTEKEEKQRQDWQYDYANRRAEATRKKEPPPIEMPDFAPYKAWAGRILSDWKKTQKLIASMSALDQQQREQAAKAYVMRHQQLVDYLATQSDGIAEFQHDVWRLAQLKSNPKANTVPYHDERISRLAATVNRSPQKWVAQVGVFGQGFHDDLHKIFTPSQLEDAGNEAQVAKALSDPQAVRLATLNQVVAWLTLGVGVCLLLGLFTRLAALAAAGFLVSIMASQPPWVPDANTTYFYYQLVELGSLFVLFAIGAGRWAGFDYFSYSIFSRISAWRNRDAT